MKKTNTALACLFMATVIYAASGQLFQAIGQNATPNQALTPEQQTAKVKERWSKALNDARLDFQNSNDRESADFVTGILDSFERPGGMSPAALVGDLERIKNRVRDLIAGKRGQPELGAVAHRQSTRSRCDRPGPA
jgi:hypothetical protein